MDGRSNFTLNINTGHSCAEIHANKLQKPMVLIDDIVELNNQFIEMKMLVKQMVENNDKNIQDVAE